MNIQDIFDKLEASQKIEGITQEIVDHPGKADIIQIIADQLRDAKGAYYNSEIQLLSDKEFDGIEEILRKIEPEHPYFHEVGAPLPSSDITGKIVHKVPMLSLQKGKNLSDVKKWVDKIFSQLGELCVQPKIDGVAATCRYENGTLSYVATRGDGSVGSDITHIASQAVGIPSSIAFSGNCEIRGELYLPKNTPYFSEGVSLRQICNGLLSRKENREDLQYVHFIAYRLVADLSKKKSREVGRRKDEFGNMQWIRKQGLEAVPCYSVFSRDKKQYLNTLTNFYNNYLDDWRARWPYETDGLVLIVNRRALQSQIDARWKISHHHHYALALKPPPPSGQATLSTISWQLSRQGHLIPVASFSPISLGGATVTRASLSNVRIFRSLKLRLGDVLVVERANEIIPRVKENLCAEGRSEVNFSHSFLPLNCPFCTHPLINGDVHTKCSNPLCPERIFQQILHWIRKVGIKVMGEGTLRMLYREGLVRSIADLYHLSADRLAPIPSFKEKKIGKILSQIAHSRTLDSLTFLSALGIPGVERQYFSFLGIKTLEDFLLFQSDRYKVGKVIISWKSDENNLSLLEELRTLIHIEDAETKENKGLVAMTGKGPADRETLIAHLKSKGFLFSSGVTKHTSILLYEEGQREGKKVDDARTKGVKLVSYREFFPELY